MSDPICTWGGEPERCFPIKGVTPRNLHQTSFSIKTEEQCNSYVHPTKITELESLPEKIMVEHEKKVVATNKEWSDKGGCENIPTGEFCSCGGGKAPSNDGGGIAAVGTTTGITQTTDMKPRYQHSHLRERFRPNTVAKGFVTGFIARPEEVRGYTFLEKVTDSENGPRHSVESFYATDGHFLFYTVLRRSCIFDYTQRSRHQ